MKSFLSRFFIIFGIVCYALTIYFVYERENPKRISFADSEFTKAASVKNKVIVPLTIDIPSAAITLPIIPAEIKNGEWEATTKGVSYLKNSPLPGETGNSILYGHNWTSLLGRLINVKPGDDVTIYFNDGSKKTFGVEYTVTVNPQQTHILAPSKDKRITLYTCTGFMDSKRFVVVGILK